MTYFPIGLRDNRNNIPNGIFETNRFLHPRKASTQWSIGLLQVSYHIGKIFIVIIIHNCIDGNISRSNAPISIYFHSNRTGVLVG